MAKSTRKTNATPAADTQLNMASTAAADLAGADDALLASLGLDMDDEIVVQKTVEPESDEAAILATVAEIEAAEANGDTVTAAPIETPAAPAKKAKAEKAAKEPKAPKEPKPAAAPRVTYVGHTKSEVLKARLGDKASELLLLEVADAALEPEALAAKQAELLDSVDKLAKKVGEKANMLFAYIRNGGKLNEVMERAFKVLARDGELTSGDKGNLQQNLLEKYSLGTARSQANQMFCLFPALAITAKEKGRMTANPNSLILMKMKAELGLA